MSNKMLFLILGIMLLVNMMSIDAVSYQQVKQDRGNNTIRNYAFIFNGQDGTPNYIPNGKPLELQVKYRTYIQTWNIANYNNTVSYCNLKIKQLYHGVNTSTLLFEKNFTGDIIDSQYFLQLGDRDGSQIFLECYFTNNAPVTLEIPADFSIVSTSWECKSCQRYTWSLVEKSVAVADNVQSKTSLTFNYITKLFLLNYEIVVFGFWILMILLLLLTVGLIFSGMAFIYKYIERIAK
jgi:hypothetical protein